MSGPYDVLASVPTPTISNLEAVMGGTAAKLVAKGRSILFVDLCDREVRREPGGRPPRRKPFTSRSPLLVADPEAFAPSRFG